MPTSAISTRVLPAERFTVSIRGARSGRLLREVEVSEATASSICTFLETGGAIARAGGELVRAAEALGQALEPLTRPPAPRKLRGRR